MLLLMYALFLAINHPLMNMSRNITVMSQSTTCGQEMALNGTKELVKAAKAPIQSKISVNPFQGSAKDSKKSGEFSLLT